MSYYNRDNIDLPTEPPIETCIDCGREDCNCPELFCEECKDTGFEEGGGFCYTCYEGTKRRMEQENDNL